MNHNYIIKQGRAFKLNLTGTYIDSTVRGSVIAILPKGGNLYQIINKKISTNPIKLNNTTSSSTSTQLYPNAIFLNNSYQIYYRSSNNIQLFNTTNLSLTDAANGILGEDVFYFALQNYDGKNNKNDITKKWKS